MAIDLAIRRKIIDFHNGGMSIRKIAERLDETKSTVHYTIKRYKSTDSIIDKPKSGRPRSLRSRGLINKVREMIRRNPRRSARDMAKKYGTSHTNVLKVLKFDLKQQCFKYVRRQVLSAATVEKRRLRGRILLDWLNRDTRSSVIWSDEKIFTVQQAWNRQNDRLWAVDLEAIPINQRTVFVRQHPAHVMVWAGVTCDGRKTPLIVIPEGVKVNTKVYLDLLKDQVLPWAQQEYGESGYCFMQDGAPAHTSNATQAWCRTNFSEFWDKQMWPPSSPDLNPMDFSV